MLGAGLLALLCLLFLCLPALADLTFPPLSGRVVDAAHVLDWETLVALDKKLAAQEAKATDQFVVATVPSLQDTSVEDYANRLFRFWKLGQAKKNNGVLLLVAPNERKVRIEVGYGLEGIITDAVASTIIRTAILPSFKAGDMAAGIVKGADAVLEILNLDPEEARQRAQGLLGEEEVDWVPVIIFVIMVLIFIYLIYRGGGHGIRRRGGGWVPSSGGGWSGGSSGGGGFSGGGGPPAAAAPRGAGDMAGPFTLSEAESARITEAVAQAETKTSAEIRLVVSAAPLVAHSHHVALWAALVALVLPWLIIVLEPVTPLRMLAVQAGAFALLCGVFSIPSVKRGLVPAREKRAAAQRLARELFLANGVHRTAERTGVLILVAPRDHLVEVLADEGAHRALGVDAWSAICRAVSEPAGAGRLADGIVAGVTLAGDILSGPLPARPGDRNELPDPPIALSHTPRTPGEG